MLTGIQLQYRVVKLNTIFHQLMIEGPQQMTSDILIYVKCRNAEHLSTKHDKDPRPMPMGIPTCVAPWR